MTLSFCLGGAHKQSLTAQDEFVRDNAALHRIISYKAHRLTGDTCVHF